MCYRRRYQRPAFTLVELLVVIALITLMAGLAAAFLPSIGENARVSNGATALQQMILTAKQKALRDQIPCGIKLVPNATNPGQLTTCLFIEQPDDFPGSSGSTLTAKGNLAKPTINLALVDQVEPNDYLEVSGTGLMHRITAVTVVGAAKTQLTLNSALPNTITTNQYRIVRLPRATSDEPLTFPDGVILDINTNTTYANPLPPPNADGSIDIVFASSGAVISPGLTTDTINLWVRDAKDAAGAGNGEQTIIAIYVRSGLTAAHPPAPGPDPYLYVKDGRTSGK